MFRVSPFAELLKRVPRGAFDRAVKRYEADKHRKGFSCWRQLVAMMYAQLAGATSLRTLAHGFNSHSAHHYHLGSAPVRRSTLAEANERGDWRVFQSVAHELMQQVQRRTRQEGEQLLRLIDSTSITLKGHQFDEWTQERRTRPTQQGMKLHVLFAVNEQAPLDELMSAPNVNDLEYARSLRLQRGVRYVFDKAYCDYSWWWQLTQSGVIFVSRFKRNARLQVHRDRPIPRAAAGIILKDELVYLANRYPGGGRINPYRLPLRRIEVARENKDPLVLVSNDLTSAAVRIAADYKARWQIELFFKWIKQHLKIKRFLGRSENAVRIQILSALIAYLLVIIQASAQRTSLSLWLYFTELRSTLFQRPQLELRRHQRWRSSRLFQDLHQQPLFV